MYCKFYNFTEKPFNVTSDPAFFFFSQHHKEALSYLFYGVNERKGIIAITGEIGTGKTTLCRFFLQRLSDNVKTAFILNPYFPEIQLVEEILRDFGVKYRQKTPSEYIWELNKFLLKEARRGNNVVLIIDEAQNLSLKQLEQIRLLSNLETEKNKLIQIVLVGQPELARKLNLYELRQLKQRITVNYHIASLDGTETKNYIKHRLAIAGESNGIEFTNDALQLISNLSYGVPRLINILCDRALLAGFVAETKKINSEIIQKCIDELGNYFEPNRALEMEEDG